MDFELTVSHTERITCPFCGKVQDADVFEGEGLPFLVYAHECISCAYTITESEWNVVECVYSGGVCNSSRCPAHRQPA